MKRRKQLVLTFFVVIASSPASLGQQGMILNQALHDLYSLSPASAGLEEGPVANVHYKRGLAGIQHGPELQQFTISGPLTAYNTGAGLNLLRQSSGMLSEVNAMATFRYRVRLTGVQSLAFGISGGVIRQSADFAKIRAQSPEELGTLNTMQTNTSADAAFGMAYSVRKFRLLVTLSHLLSPTVRYTDVQSGRRLTYSSVPLYLLAATHDFSFGKGDWALHPGIILRSNQGLDILPDVSCHADYKKKVMLGAGYRPGTSLYFNLGISPGEHLQFIYSYESAAALQAFARGGHEIGIRFGFHRPAVSAPLHTGEISELEEKLYVSEERSRKIQGNIDSLEKNLALLRKEIEVLKEQQVGLQTVIAGFAGSGMNDTAGNRTSTAASQRRVISGDNVDEENDGSPRVRSKYQIVLGVYQQLSFARNYQKFIRRNIGWETSIHAPEVQKNGYIYVTIPAVYTELDTALKELRRIRTEVNSGELKITKGDPWILQTTE